MISVWGGRLRCVWWAGSAVAAFVSRNWDVSLRAVAYKGKAFCLGFWEAQVRVSLRRRALNVPRRCWTIWPSKISQSVRSYWSLWLCFTVPYHGEQSPTQSPNVPVCLGTIIPLHSLNAPAFFMVHPSTLLPHCPNFLWYCTIIPSLSPLFITDPVQQSCTPPPPRISRLSHCTWGPGTLSLVCQCQNELPTWGFALSSFKEIHLTRLSEFWNVRQIKGTFRSGEVWMTYESNEHSKKKHFKCVNSTGNNVDSEL